MSNTLKTLWVLLVLLVFIAVLGKVLVFEIVRTDSYSMVPNLFPGDVFLVNRRASLDLGDIAVCKNPKSGTLMASRIIGVPGTTVAMKNDRLYVDGKEIQGENQGEKKYINNESNERLEFKVQIYREYFAGWHMDVARMNRSGYKNMRTRKVEFGLFLMGDNRNRATDSRDFDEIPASNCIGQATIIIWPSEDNGDFKKADRYFKWL